MRLQIEPHRLPVLRGRFHHHFGDSPFLQPTHHMPSFQLAGSKTSAFELDGLARGILYLGGHRGDHHHQHLLVNVD